MIEKQFNKMPNWKGPGPDGFQGYWLTSIKAKSHILAALFTKALQSGHARKWLTTKDSTISKK